MTRTARSAAQITSLVCLLTAAAVLAGPVAIASTVTSPLPGVTQPAKTQPAKGQAAAAPAPASAASLQAAASDYASIFAAQNANLTNSGWATCAAPIGWTVDSHELTTAETATQVANLQWAFDQWAAVSGLSFRYEGQLAVNYDDAAFTMKPADGSVAALRHIYLDFVPSAESTRLGGGTVGLGSPSQVISAAKEIVGGAAVFRVDHVKKSGAVEDKSLYLHELGHVLGLAHANETANIMYPIVTDHVALGSGDVNGVKLMAKPCSA